MTLCADEVEDVWDAFAVIVCAMNDERDEGPEAALLARLIGASLEAIPTSVLGRIA